jgi:hypothetical protein
MFISGCVPYKNKRERKQIYRKLKDELGSSCYIYSENKMLIYQMTAPRSECYIRNLI